MIPDLTPHKITKKNDDNSLMQRLQRAEEQLQLAPWPAPLRLGHHAEKVVQLGVVMKFLTVTANRKIKREELK